MDRNIKFTILINVKNAFSFEIARRIDVFEGKISDVANSSLDLAETKFYEAGLAPPCLLRV